tara:strand:+ start:773 stop:994 length:222 start_codon:yes stop_codon:yes gene_type:complete
MPTYVFGCDECKDEFEITCSIKEYKKYILPKKCDTLECAGAIRRLFTPVGIAFGPGFFKDGYESAKNVRRSEE